MIKLYVPVILALNAAVPPAFADDSAARFATMTAEQVRAFEDEVKARIKTMDGVEAMETMADLALIPPQINTSPLPEYGYDRLDYGMTIGIERTPGGRLWACWVAGGDSPKAFFVLATSDDDGETWSDPRLVVDSHNANLPRDRSVLVGNLWTDPLGRLWLIFDQSMDHFDGRGGVWVSLCENPDADQPAWSQPRRIWHGVTLNKPTVLSTGEWMLPISFDQRGGLGAFKGAFKKLDPLRGANVFVSTDQGATWQRHGVALFPKPDWHEHMIVERKDSTLWMLARTGTGIMECTSPDGGRTWSQPIPSKVKHPVARFHIRRLASGRILLVKHGRTIDTHEGRSMLTAWLSEDEGQTWQGGLMLDERKGISYPDGFQAPDGTIYISYDRNRSTDGEILLARFTEEDILAGKTIGPKSKFRVLISRPLARDVAKLPKFAGPTPGVPRTITIPTVDISGETERHSIVARGSADVYHGHCDTVLLPDGKTMFTAWTVDHAQRIGPLARSDDGGRTWSAPLDVPANWHSTANTPAIHRLVDPQGKARLVVFGDGLDWRRKGRPPYPMHQAISEDNGKTWTPMKPNGVQGEVPPKTILSFDDGRRLILWSDLPGYVVQSESFDGGLTWRRQRYVLRIPDRWGQPCVIRSPDGKQLLMLMRENSRHYHSLYSISNDNAQTWSVPRELPASLTGDRHVARYAPDGRLVVAMRDRAKTSRTYGHYVAWVGRYEDIAESREGQYRIKLLHNAARTDNDAPGKGNADCGYSDLEVLPDGTVVATTYIKYQAGPERNSVVNTRFKLSEIDALRRFHVTSRTSMQDTRIYPAGTVRITYRSGVDGEEDWALYRPGNNKGLTVVYLHGSFSSGDQIFTRKDIRDFWLTKILAADFPLLSINMRGTSYMSPAAATDLTDLLNDCREHYDSKGFVLLGGSGGASSAMAYACLEPKQVTGVIAMGMCDITARLDFARKSEHPVLRKLAETVFTAYGGSLEEKPEFYRARSVLAHATELTMPIILTMGEKDALIPVEETRKVAQALRPNPDFRYHEVPKGDHDSALWVDVDLEAFEQTCRQRSGKE